MCLLPGCGTCSLVCLCLSWCLLPRCNLLGAGDGQRAGDGRAGRIRCGHGGVGQGLEPLIMAAFFWKYEGRTDWLQRSAARRQQATQAMLRISVTCSSLERWLASQPPTLSIPTPPTVQSPHRKISLALPTGCNRLQPSSQGMPADLGGRRAARRKHWRQRWRLER